MGSRDDLIKQAKAKWDRDQLVAEAKSKWEADNSPAVEPESRMAEAAIEGFGQGATMGYLPQLQALAAKLMPDPNADLDAELARQGFHVQAHEPSYVEERDAMIARGKGLAEQHPIAHGAGVVTGAVAGAALPAKALPAALSAPAAGITGRLAQAAGTGAIMGAAQNPGDVEGEMSPLQLDERISNAEKGAAFGAAAQGLGEGVAKGFGALAKGSRGRADAAALKASGANAGDFQRAIEKKRLPDLARTALNAEVEVADETGKAVTKRLVERGDTVADVAEKVIAFKQKTGERIGAIYDEVQAKLADPELLQSLKPEKLAKVRATEFTPVAYADQLRAEAAAALKGKPDGGKVLERVNGILDSLVENGETANLSAMQEFKEHLDDIIKWDKAQMPLEQKQLMRVRDFLKERIQDRVQALDETVGGTLLKELKAANQSYSAASELGRISVKGQGREAAKLMFGLVDRQAAIGGAVLGGASALSADDVPGALKRGAIGAVGGALASRAARTMGPAVQARAFDSIAKAFAENPGLQQGAIPELVYLAKQNPAFAPSAAANMLPKQDKPPSAVDLIDRQAAPAQRSQDVEVPEELRVEARARIQKAGHLSTVEKARAMDKLNRHGKLDTSVLGGLAQPAAAPDAAPVARKPSGSTNQDMKDAVDFVRQKRREDF